MASGIAAETQGTVQGLGSAAWAKCRPMTFSTSDRAERLGRSIRVVLVEPESEGNIGSVARAMMNFGLQDLWLVNPKAKIGAEALAYSAHAGDIVRNAKIAQTLDDALVNVGYVIGTSAIFARSPSNLLRAAITPRELATKLSDSSDCIALLFGRESAGLNNRELERCDLLISIPASPEYPVLNVATAASIIFYELHQTKSAPPLVAASTREDRERLVSLFEQACDVADVPAHRKRLAVRAFRAIVSRAFISQRESTLLLGVLRRALRLAKRARLSRENAKLAGAAS